MSNSIDRQQLAYAKKLFKSFYEIPDGVDKKQRKKYETIALENYEGFNTTTECDRFCRKYKVNIDFYYAYPRFKASDPEKYELVEQVIVDKTYSSASLLRIPAGNNKFHICYIDDPTVLTGYEICPYCKCYVFDNKLCHDRKRFEKHMKECKECNGKIIREVSLPNTQKPYAPHIQKQKIYQFLFARGMENQFKPTKYYITFDFETLEDPINEEVSEQTTIDANLVPFMVSSTVKLPSGTQTVNFCLSNNEHFPKGKLHEVDFVESWIEWLFNQASLVSEANKAQYDDLLRSCKNEKDGVEFYKLLKSEYSTSNVIGFNSGKFDLNLILANLCSPKWRIKTIIGSSSQYKMISVFKINDKGNISESETGLRFIDIRNYIAGGTLDQFTKDFGNNDGKRVKSFFPYQFITVQNWRDELMKHEPFEQKDFYSALTKTSISDEDYKTYLEDSKNYKSRLEYFIHYCNKDVEIMIDPIDAIINETFEHKVDMLHNMSLSSNASMIRYSMAFKDFKPNEFYPSTNAESSFKLTKKYWAIKVKGYEAQDVKGKEILRIMLKNLIMNISEN